MLAILINLQEYLDRWEKGYGQLFQNEPIPLNKHELM